MLKAIIFLLPALAFAEDPDWIKKADRQIISDNIVHWGYAEAEEPSIAQFKAEQMAIKSIVDECGGFYHKTITIRKKYIKREMMTFHAYALASIDFPSCDYGKNPLAKTNMDVESPTIRQSQELYIRSLSNPNSIDIKQEIINQLNQKTLSNEESIRSLEKQVTDLQKKKQTDTASSVTIQQVIIKGDAAAKKECLSEYSELMREAQTAAIDNGGNLTSGKAAPIYNQAVRKLYKCQQIK